MANTQELFYAFVGLGDATVERIKGISIAPPDRKKTQKLYKDFVKRGRSLSSRIKTAAPTKQAITQTKAARTQVKAAATSVTKVVAAGTSGSGEQLKKQTKTARTQVKAAATSVNKAVRANAKATRSAAGKVATKASA